MVSAIRSALPLTLAGLLAGATVVIINACSNQPEGERCSVLAEGNGNDDCQDGLVCTEAKLLNNAGDTDRCCPANRSTATTSVCSLQITPDGGNPAVPDDADTPDAPAVDGGDDASDAAPDAPFVDASDASDGGDDASDGGTD